MLNTALIQPLRTVLGELPFMAHIETQKDYVSACLCTRNG